ncbi:TonB-dependent receptor [Novosphingobium sp. FSY-8]|uniref:TonB-dependent receptor n=1 Tax=Novosphingobium ovatum TaxID=1908523 RepID=A0ABW9XC75_9SPHN|nr:TonB-dependent receptor [Novosphingobium ovatum]NBC36143.1 TonB-dependent receptor [Novosphingobium ovatum]
MNRISARALAWMPLMIPVMVALAQAPVAVAQTAAPAGDAAQPAVPEIVVTAQFRQERLQSTPIAITAMSGAMLQARSQSSLADIASQAPSVTLKSQSAVYGPALGANIRGIGQYERIPGYALANARISWKNPNHDLEIAAEVTNLFDRYYYSTVFDNTASAGYATAQPGRPREVALTVRKSF